MRKAAGLLLFVLAACGGDPATEEDVHATVRQNDVAPQGIYIKIGGVDGETKPSPTATAPGGTSIAPPPAQPYIPPPCTPTIYHPC
jgi:hypothetical protein